MILVDIGVFAHNEADSIGTMLRSLYEQDLFNDPAYSVHLHILANGCTDTTVSEARKTIAEHGPTANAIVHDIPEGGKSRTWNNFVHDLGRPNTEILVFLDADIQIPSVGVLTELCHFLRTSPGLAGVSSRPVKDIMHDPSLQNGLLDKLITAAGGTLDYWKTSICGQLYLLKSDVARSFHIPIGLPTEDGFVRAMVQTVNFTREGAPETRLDGREDLFHVYASERSISALIQHQTRLVIGSAINAVIYARLRGLKDDDRMKELKSSAEDPTWLPELLNNTLPRLPYGYVPTHFLFKRLGFWMESPNKFHPKRVLLIIAGFAFDAVVYVRAQAKMWQGVGAGYW